MYDWAGVHVRSHDAVGVCTGVVRRCPMAGCTGIRVYVRWPDGKLTYPCTKGLFPEENEWRIG